MELVHFLSRLWDGYRLLDVANRIGSSTQLFPQATNGVAPSRQGIVDETAGSQGSQLS